MAFKTITAIGLAGITFLSGCASTATSPTTNAPAASAAPEGLVTLASQTAGIDQPLA